MKRLKNAAQAAARVAAAAVQGQPLLVSKEMEAKRIGECRVCPHFCPSVNDNLSTCGACGCFVHAKAKLATENCPKRRWPFVGKT